jgi:hypothetical protein
VSIEKGKKKRRMREKQNIKRRRIGENMEK